MMINVDKLKEFMSKNWFMKSELGSIQVIDVKKIIDFINANQVEGEVIEVEQNNNMIIIDTPKDQIEKLIIVKKQVVSLDKEGE